VRRIFADTFYFCALLNSADAHHERVSRFSKTIKATVVTSAWVLTEVADGMAQPRNRPSFLRLLSLIESDRTFVVIPPTDAIFQQGINLYKSRPDKEWSLTDCISFEIMQHESLHEALTGDHHFEQAGFVALLK
jgi:uncharacterized protein